MTNQTTRANPFVGPRAFRSGERLFGRDYELHELTNLLIAERIVLLHSPSGAGKSSLLQAGMIPRLRDEGFLVMPVVRVSLAPPGVTIAPGFNRYIYSTLASLDEGLPDDQRHTPAELVRMSLPGYLDEKPAAGMGENGDQSNVVLIFDQFEEILTVDPNDLAGKNAFFAQLGEVLRDRSRWALFAMREDHLPALAPFLRPVPTHLSSTYRLDFLNIESAVEAIREPVHLSDVEFDKDAAQKLVDDLRRVQIQLPDGSVRLEYGPCVEPLQLQVVCYRLWENLSPDDKNIDVSDIDSLGDVDRSLAEYYNQRVSEIARQSGTPERSIRTWFQDQLITPTGLRGQVLLEQGMSKGLENSIIRQLENANLVRAEKRGGSIWYELAHDRLITPVRESNLAWFDANLNLLQKQAVLWEAQGRSEGLLLRGSELSQAEAWAGQHGQDLNAVERRFLNTSQQALRREREAQQLREQSLLLDSERKRAEAEQARAEMERHRADEQVRATRRIRALAMFIGLFALVAIGLALLASYQSTQAVHAKDTAVAALTQAYYANVSALEVQNVQSTQSAVDAQQSATRQSEILAATSTQQAQLPSPTPPASTPGGPAGPDLESISRAMADASQNVSAMDLSLLLAIQASKFSDSAFSRQALLSRLDAALAQNGELLPVLFTEGSGQPASLSISPDGSELAFTGAGRLLRWNIQEMLAGQSTSGSAVVQTLNPGSVRYAYYNPSGSLFAMLDSSAGRELALRRVNVDGLVVSHWDGKVDWRQASSLPFAYAKATEGDGYLDPSFADNWFGMKEAGLLRGSYHYFKLGVDSLNQAFLFLKVVSLEAGDLPPMLDVEEKKPAGMSDDQLKKAVLDWLTTVKEFTGRTPVIGFRPDSTYARMFTQDPDFKDYPLWVLGSENLLSPNETLDGRRWTFSSLSSVTQLKGSDRQIAMVRFNGSLTDLRSLAYSSFIQDAATGKIVFSSVSSLTSPVASKSGSLVAYRVGGGAFQIVDTSTFQPINLPFVLTAVSQVVCINDNARFLVVNNSDGSTAVLGFDGPYVPLDLSGARSAIYCAFSQDNRFLGLVSDSGEVSFWNVSDLSYIQNITKYKPPSPAKSLAISADARWLAVGQGNGDVTLYDMIIGVPVYTWSNAHDGFTTHLVFSPTQDILASSGADGKVWVVNLSLSNLTQVACRLAGRDMTEEEWNTFAPDVPREQTCSPAASAQ